MVVAFLDLLGFSELLRISTEIARDNMTAFNEVMRCRTIDNIGENLDSNDSFATKSASSSISYMISFSDSLILGSWELDSFVKQLSNFVATIYIEYTRPFQKEFDDLYNVESDRNASGKGGVVRNHKAVPVLFRGGLSLGTDVRFFEESYIWNGNVHVGCNVSGETYLNAVNLEKQGKGPRLFCDKSIVGELKDKSMIRLVDKEKELYEIVWTVEACEATECWSEYIYNVRECIEERMLPAAINLFKFYSNHKDEYEKVLPHYKELLNLVCRGIVKYAKIKGGKAEETLNLINDKLDKEGMQRYALDELMDGFLN